MTKAQKIKLVSRELNTLSAIPVEKRPADENGNLDVKALNRMPEVKKVVVTLKEAGVTKECLLDNGFMAAAMILIFKD